MSLKYLFSALIFTKIIYMKKLLSKLDFTLLFRLCLSIIMLLAAFTQKDYAAGLFGLFLAFYAIIGAKYKVGCGYDNCGYVPKYQNKNVTKLASDEIDFIEIK